MTTRIHPVARYADARAAITFLEGAFGFAPRAIHDGPGGTIAHAELAFGTGTFGLSSTGPVDPSNVWSTVREGVYVSLADPDAHHARARAAGARIERELQDLDYGSREFTARDPEGRLWSFGTYRMSEVNGPAVLVVELQVRDGDAMLAFLHDAFGFEPGLEVRDAAGGLTHGELWFDGQPLMLGGRGAGAGIWRGRTQCTQVYLSDPDAHFARARSAGATIVREVSDTSYGTRGYLAQDPEGFLWGFSTYKPQRRG